MAVGGPGPVARPLPRHKHRGDRGQLGSPPSGASGEQGHPRAVTKREQDRSEGTDMDAGSLENHSKVPFQVLAMVTSDLLKYRTEPGHIAKLPHPT
jgi:hypothetical protein